MDSVVVVDNAVDLHRRHSLSLKNRTSNTDGVPAGHAQQRERHRAHWHELPQSNPSNYASTSRIDRETTERAMAYISRGPPVKGHNLDQEQAVRRQFRQPVPMPSVQQGTSSVCFY